MWEHFEHAQPSSLLSEIFLLLLLDLEGLLLAELDGEAVLIIFRPTKASSLNITTMPSRRLDNLTQSYLSRGPRLYIVVSG